MNFAYELSDSVEDKLIKIAAKIYGADGVEFSDKARRQIDQINKNGFASLPVCVAKTQFSLSDDHKKLGRPKGFDIYVKNIKISAGAGFIVAYAGDIMTMPGFPAHPAAERIDIDGSGNITGLF